MMKLSGYNKKPEATRRINIWLYPEDEEAIKKIKESFITHAKSDAEAIRAALRHTHYDITTSKDEMFEEWSGKGSSFANSGKDSQGNNGQ